MRIILSFVTASAVLIPTLLMPSLLMAEKKDIDANLKGKVQIDGSSTVYPITEAVAEEFGHKYPNVRVTVGISGTGGGFKRFAVGEVDMNNASRHIKDSEITKAKENKIEYVELPVAFDGLSVVVNAKNDWVDTLTPEQLNLIWKPGSKIKMWSQINPKWPEKEIKLYGPGTDSGTFDYFTEAINGKAQASRSDYTKSEDDNTLVKGVVGDKFALGYFGYAYYLENKDRIKSLAIDAGEGPVKADKTTIMSGKYKPLSRPLFIYVSSSAAQRPEVVSFVRFYLQNAASLVGDVGYIPMPAQDYKDALKKFEDFAKNSAKS